MLAARLLPSNFDELLAHAVHPLSQGFQQAKAAAKVLEGLPGATAIAIGVLQRPYEHAVQVRSQRIPVVGLLLHRLAVITHNLGNEWHRTSFRERGLSFHVLTAEPLPSQSAQRWNIGVFGRGDALSRILQK